MTRLILTLNTGSSSAKFALFEPGATPTDTPVERLRGQVSAIRSDPQLTYRVEGGEAVRTPAPGAGTHKGALAAILDVVNAQFPNAEVPVVGHRIVHGGTRMTGPTRVDAHVRDYLASLTPFAPLHQPHGLSGLEAAIAQFPDAVQFACFDTSFHRGQPFESDAYALPRSYFDKGIRRYGFHGLSYDYIAGEMRRIAPEARRVVIAHLGNGSSMCAVKDGRSVDSTMGFTALDGLVMGTRCGQLDPGVVLYMLEQEGMSAAEVSEVLYKRSGLLGLSGISNDMRVLEASGAAQAREAISVFVARIRREFGALTAVLGGVDAFVFTAGIGENSASIRAQVCEGMDWFGLALDPEKNAAGEGLISAEGSRVGVYAIRTDEEMTIAKAAAAFLD